MDSDRETKITDPIDETLTNQAVGLEQGDKDHPSTSSSDPEDERIAPSDVVDDDELDALLNDALQDFGKPAAPSSNFKPRIPINSTGMTGRQFAEAVGGVGDDLDMSNLWSDEFIKEATAEFEKKMRAYVDQAKPGTSQSKSNAFPTPNIGATASNPDDPLHHVIDAATKAALKSSDPGLDSTLNEAIKELASNPDFLQNPMSFSDNELAKLLENFGINDDDDKAEEGLLPFMTTMMQKLLSKELLHPVLGDIVERYPAWLSENKGKLSNTEYEKYVMQYEQMKKICEEYSKEKETDPEEVKKQRYEDIQGLMLKVQSSGPPPKDLTGEDEPGGFGHFDPTLTNGAPCSVM